MNSPIRSPNLTDNDALTDNQARALSDIEWQAFLYLSHELPTDAIVAFEAELAASQPAREALAALVGLQHAVLLAGSAETWLDREQSQQSRDIQLADRITLSSSRSSRWMQPAVWLAIGAAACLLLIVGVQSWQTAADRTKTRTISSSSAAADLALRWSSVRDAWDEIVPPRSDSYRSELIDSSLTDGGSGSESISIAGEIGNAGLENAGLDDSDMIDEFESPDWLLATIAGQKIGLQDETTEPLKPVPSDTSPSSTPIIQE